MNQLIEISAIEREIASVSTPQDCMQLEAKIKAVESYMREAGLYSLQEIIPVNEAKMRARWKLGRLLAEVDRGKPGPAGDKGATRPYLKDYIKSINLAETAAKEAQRIAWRFRRV